MNTVVMTRGISEARPRLLARLAGAFYLLTILTGVLAQFVISNKLVVFGDAAATATNILTHQLLFQTAFAVYLVEMACQVTMVALFYQLLKPAGRNVSMVAAFIGLTSCAVKTVARLFFITPLFVLGGEHYLSVFNTKQLHTLALLFLDVNDHGAAMALAFFGFYTILKGYLAIRCTFLPRFLGVLSILAGLSLLSYLYPPLGYRLFPYIAAIGLLGAAAWIFWLLVFAVNEQRWRKQAGETFA